MKVELLQTDEAEQLVALPADWLFDDDALAEFGDEGVHPVGRPVAERVLASSEDHLDLHLVAFGQELLGRLLPDLPVVVADLERQADALDLDALRAGFALPLELLLAVEVGAIVEEFADRRPNVRRDLDEVKAAFLREAEGFSGRDDAQRFLLLVDERDLGNPNLLVDPEELGTDGCGVTDRLVEMAGLAPASTNDNLPQSTRFVYLWPSDNRLGGRREAAAVSPEFLGAVAGRRRHPADRYDTRIRIVGITGRMVVSRLGERRSKARDAECIRHLADKRLGTYRVPGLMTQSLGCTVQS